MSKPIMKNHLAPEGQKGYRDLPISSPQHPSSISPVSTGWASHFCGQRMFRPTLPTSLLCLFPVISVS